MRIAPLVEANLKGFIRNKKSILLLVIFPLVLISVVFLSFSSQGLGKVPAGFIMSPDFKDTSELEEAATFLTITYYTSLDLCLSDLKNYNTYLCIQPEGQTNYIFNIYFDNTREPVIWEVLEKTKRAFDVLQEKRSREMATDVIGSFGSISQKISSFKSSLGQVTSMIDNYISETDASIDELTSAKQELGQSIDSMESDINSISDTETKMKNSKSRAYSNSISQIEYVESSAGHINATSYEDIIYLNSIKSSCSALKSQINSYDDESDGYFYEMDTKIANYRLRCQQGRQYIYKMDQSISKLKDTKNNLATYKGSVQSTDSELGSLKAEMDQMGSISPDTMVNPITVTNKQVYRPGQGSSSGNSLFSLQTIFPQMLLLIVMFLSLLVSSFIALSEINLPANIRVSIIRGITMQEFISTYISSMLIVIFPIFIVLILGENLFGLHIFWNIIAVSLILFLVTTIFIITGISVAYVVKNESISLVITTFMLLFLIFFSGYVLPVERMSPGSKFFAEICPGTIALSAFNKTVFYDLEIGNIGIELANLGTWAFLVITAGIIVKQVSNT